MNEHQILSIVSILGFLILVVAGFRQHNLDRRRMLWMGGGWAGIFAIVILFIGAVR